MADCLGYRLAFTRWTSLREATYVTNALFVELTLSETRFEPRRALSPQTFSTHGSYQSADSRRPGSHPEWTVRIDAVAATGSSGAGRCAGATSRHSLPRTEKSLENKPSHQRSAVSSVG